MPKSDGIFDTTKVETMHLKTTAETERRSIFAQDVQIVEIVSTHFFFVSCC